MEINGIAGLRTARGDAVFENHGDARARGNPDHFPGGGFCRDSRLRRGYRRWRVRLRPCGFLRAAKLAEKQTGTAANAQLKKRIRRGGRLMISLRYVSSDAPGVGTGCLSISLSTSVSADLCCGRSPNRNFSPLRRLPREAPTESRTGPAEQALRRARSRDRISPYRSALCAPKKHPCTGC